MNNNFVKNIINIYNKEKIKVPFSSIRLDFFAHKYSSSKVQIFHLYIDDERLTKKNKHLFEYKCLTCSLINCVSATQILRKINHNSPQYCYNCYNTDEQKRINHSNNMNDENIKTKIVDKIKSKTPLELYEIGKSKFKDLPIENKDNYWKTHLTEDEFQKLLPNIVSFRNGNIIKSIVNTLLYFPIYPCNNQQKFTSVFYNPLEKSIIKADQPIIKCDNCNLEWRAKKIEQFKESIKIMCKNCKLCRKTFKKRHDYNIKEELIIYQSKPEKQFIDWCKNNNIYVLNGPILTYCFNEKSLKYYVDFYIPDIKYLIEIKDDHIWHKNQLLSGQWKSKTDAVLKQLENGTYNNYLLIKPNNKSTCFSEILSKINKI